MSGGKQYYLYRWTGVVNGNPFRYWFVSTQQTGWPNGQTPYWACRHVPGVLNPGTGSGAAGVATGLNPARLDHGFAYTGATSGVTQFSYAGDRPARWTQAKDLWVDGYWGELWAEYHLPVAGVDPVGRLVTLAAPVPKYGLEEGQPWFAYNLLEEITRPGEWYLDRESGILYLWPPAGFGAASEVTLSMVEGQLFNLNATAHWALRDLILEAPRHGAVYANKADGLQLTRLLLRNTGTHAVVANGRDILVGRCTVRDSGNGAIDLTGGDRATLTGGGLRIEDCDVSRFARFVLSGHTGLSVRGCGATVRNNHVYDTTQSAIDFGGNEHVIELNDVHDVCQVTADAGAIYSGRDWGARGNIVRHNFIHRLHSIFNHDLNGLYLDDAVSGIRAEGNIVYDVTGAGIKAGGGRDNKLKRNLIIRCGNALYADSRALEWQKLSPPFPNSLPGDSSNLLEKLGLLKYRQDPWLSRYPECARIPDDWAIVSDLNNRWLWPEGTVFSRNVCWGNFRLIEATTGTTERMQEIAGNLVDVDPLFVDEAAGDLRLRADSPVRALPGWQDIPFERIGVRE